MTMAARTWTNGRNWGGVAVASLAVLGLWGCGASLPQIPAVSIAPAAVTLQAGGGTQQFTATVTNASNTTVVWKVNGHMGGDATNGTITQAGLYTAPATVPSAPVTVEAVSAANATSQASAVITLTPPVTLTLTPAKATLPAGGQQQFNATVTNATNTAVTWSVNGTVGGSSTTGTISPQGLYLAPKDFPGLGTITITVASVQDPSVTATAAVTLAQPVTVTVSPATATVAPGGKQPFAAAVSGASTTTVTWSVNGVAGGNAGVGTIDANGNFTAPATVPSPATVTVTATSTADTSASGTAAVTIASPVSVSITPATVSLAANATQQFTATVSNASNTAVTWSVNGAVGGSSSVGTISTAGLYTAPASFPGIPSVTVTAASVADPNATASATVTLVQPVAVTITPTATTVSLGASQAFSATVTGSTNTAVSWSVNGTAGGSAALGTINAQGLFTAPTTMPSPTTETVTATSVADATKSASGTITLQPPPSQFSLSPATTTLSLGKAASGSVSFQLTLSPGFTQPVGLAVSGLPVNVTAALNPTSLGASGTVNLTLTTASISLARSGVPITLTASAKDANGNALVQTATVALTITGWAGHVATLAGGAGGIGFFDGTGAAAELEPAALATDGSNVFFADRRGDALREIGIADQTVTTLDGWPYSYSAPDGEGMVYDAANQTIYISDALRNQIEQFKLGGYLVTSLAGSGVAGHADGTGAAAEFNNPRGLAMSADGATLYVADFGNNLIRAVTVATGAVTTVAGQWNIYRSTDGVGTAATFCEPAGMAIDPAGANLYVSDYCGDVIRRIALPSLTVTTVAGSGAAGQADGPAASATFASLSGLAVDPHAAAPLLYIADGNEIRALTLGTSPAVFTVAGNPGAGQSDGAGGSASFYTVDNFAAVADANGAGTTTLFVADSDNGLMRRVDLANPLTATNAANVQANVTTLAGHPSHRGNADGVGTGPGYTGVSTAAFNQPTAIVTDGKVAYVSDGWNGAIRKIDLATTQVTTVAGPAQGYADGVGSQAAFYHNAGLAWVPSQNVIYIADAGNACIRKLDLTTDTVTTLAGVPSQPGLVDGTLAQARFNNPWGILASPDGTKLYVADTGDHVIREIDLTAGTVSTIAGSGGWGFVDGVGNQAEFKEPTGLAFDATGNNIFITDFEAEAIRELNLNTDAVTTIVGMQQSCGYADGPASSATLCNPAMLTTDGRSLFWGDSNTGLLRVLNLSTMQVSTLAGNPGEMHVVNGDMAEAPGELTGPVRYNGVFGLAVAPDDSFLLFTDRPENVVRIIY
jgi:sugar lactone lactonase YvrE